MSINKILYFFNDCIFHNKICKIFKTVKIKQLFNILTKLSALNAALNNEKEINNNNIINDYNFNEM